MDVRRAGVLAVPQCPGRPAGMEKNMNDPGWLAMGNPPWLPPSVLRRQAIEEAHERAEAKRAEEARANRAEEQHQRALTLYREQAASRGEELSVLDVARGLNVGRTVGEVLADAAMQADREDRLAAHRARYEPVVPQHIDFSEPVVHETVSPARRSLLTRHRRFTEWQERKAEAEAARRQLAAEFDHGLAASQRQAPKSDPVVDLTTGLRRLRP
jgi:hypothetical protein